MGKDWLYWVGGGVGGGSTAKKRQSGDIKEAAAAATTSAGCMCAVFQLFDLHHFQLPLNHQNHENSCLQEEATSSKGVEAPRNSLELDKPAPIKTNNSVMKVEDDLNFPVGIQIKTRHGKLSSPRMSKTDDFSSECGSCSPGTKTPSLVARLMGLDLLPEATSPSITSRSSTSKSQLKSHFFHQKNQRHFRGNNTFFDDDISVGARSLPETPRMSSSSRKSDVEYHHHRLSLQVNKDNLREEFQVSDKLSRKGRRARRDENFNRSSSLTTSSSSPGQYARQIVKQVRESVSRRVGLSDITNRNNKENEIIRRDENLILLKPVKKSSRFDGSDVTNNTTPSCSPRLRFLDTHKSKQVLNSGTKSPRISSSSPSDDQNNNNNYPSSQRVVTINPQQENHYHDQQQQQKEYISKKVAKCSSTSSSVRKLPHQGRDKAIRSNKEEQFVRTKITKREKKLKKNDILSISAPTLLQVKKDPSPPPTKLPQKQVPSDAVITSKISTQLSSIPSRTHPRHHPKISTAATRGGAAAASGNYIKKILVRTGIILDKKIPSPSIKWHTPSHPIDPSVFYYLELFHPTAAVSGGSGAGAALRRRCDRKLIFQLVDELLADILKPHLGFRTRVCQVTGSAGTDGSVKLFDKLIERIEEFPGANCRVLEDIDSLIGKDMCGGGWRMGGFWEGECEGLVSEIENGILEDLVNETAAFWV